MFRLFAFTAALLIAAPAFADEKKAEGKGKLDKSKMFEVMDADGDGKVGKDEFKKGMEKMAEKLKERAGDKGGKGAAVLEKLGDKLGEKLFEKLDADSDGKLTKEEFEKAEFDPTKLRELLGKGK
ncbi:MAG: EF-hand domain-containing protein [Fimbriiglobus sp.]|nr:EF-hand domain-containing protein [Fimbriiglobus sp.]